MIVHIGMTITVERIKGYSTKCASKFVNFESLVLLNFSGDRQGSSSMLNILLVDSNASYEQNTSNMNILFSEREVIIQTMSILKILI
jgi:hypothetical protein